MRQIGASCCYAAADTTMDISDAIDCAVMRAALTVAPADIHRNAGAVQPGAAISATYRVVLDKTAARRHCHYLILVFKSSIADFSSSCSSFGSSSFGSSYSYSSCAFWNGYQRNDQHVTSWLLHTKPKGKQLTDGLSRNCVALIRRAATLLIDPSHPPLFEKEKGKEKKSRFKWDA